MKRIIIHWTAGGYNANSVDKEHYHFIVQGDGSIVCGKFKPENNLICRPGQYAAHTGGGNTKSIGISFAGMAGYIEGKPNSTKYPITPKQFEAGAKKIAELCNLYKIPITSDCVLTHYEFGKKNPNSSSSGKIDIIFLPPFASVSKNQVGDFIRNKVLWYYQRLK